MQRVCILDDEIFKVTVFMLYGLLFALFQTPINLLGTIYNLMPEGISVCVYVQRGICRRKVTVIL